MHIKIKMLEICLIISATFAALGLTSLMVSLPENFWVIAPKAICALAATALLSLGVYLALKNYAITSGLLLSFALLFTLLLLGSKFKHVKGFGFEAEMWEQKQEEAVNLIDKFSALSKVTSEQIVDLTLGQGMILKLPDIK